MSRTCQNRTHALRQTASSFDYLIGELLNMQRHFEAERLRNLEVDHQLELSRLHDRQIGRLGAAQRATGSMPPVNVP